MYVNKEAQTTDFCDIVPSTTCNPEFGSSIGRGLFQFTTGEWNILRQEVKLNTFTNGTPNPDGEISVFVNDATEPAIQHSKIVFRKQPDITASGIHFESFFGGGKPGFETPVDQFTMFKAFKLAHN